MMPRPLLKLLRWVRSLDRTYKGATIDIVSKDHIDAARSLSVTRDHKIWERSQVYDYRFSHPDIVKFWRSFHKQMESRNIPVRAFEFTRSPERQEQLFNQGRSKARSGQSPHQIHTFRFETHKMVSGQKIKQVYFQDYSAAVDVIHALRGWELTKKEWDVIGIIGKEVARKRKIEIEWGGDWHFYDPAHWQLKKWKQLLQ